MILVSKVFDGPGFGSWKHAMIIALLTKNKIRFINGDCKRHEENSPDLRHWEKCYNMVISWILNALPKEKSEIVFYSTTAKEIWGELEELFDQSNGAQLFQIPKELNQISQGSTLLPHIIQK